MAYLLINLRIITSGAGLNNLLMSYTKYALKLFLILMVTVSISSYAAKDNSVNVIAWWGYLDSPEIVKKVKARCNVNMSYDTYYTNHEFLRRVRTNKSNYDIIIFSNTIYDLVKNQIPKTNVNLAKFSRKFHPVIRKKYIESSYPSNVVYFMHSLTGFLWNPKVINLNSSDTVQDIFRKAGKNIVVMIDDPAEIQNLIHNTYKSQHGTDYQKTDLTTETFKKLVQDATVYVVNNYNQVYDQKSFAFAYGWTGDAIVYMKQTNKEFKFLIQPQLSYITTDLLAAMNDNSETACVANVLMNKKVLDIVQNNTYYFSPYGDYQVVNSPVYQSVYRDVFDKLSVIPWLEVKLSSNEFEKLVDKWNDIQLNVRGS